MWISLPVDAVSAVTSNRRLAAEQANEAVDALAVAAFQLMAAKEKVDAAKAANKVRLEGKAYEVRDGDIIEIDIPGRTLSLVGHKAKMLKPREADALLAGRRKKWKAPALRHTPGILRRYSIRAASAMRGAYLED